MQLLVHIQYHHRVEVLVADIQVEAHVQAEAHILTARVEEVTQVVEEDIDRVILCKNT